MENESSKFYPSHQIEGPNRFSITIYCQEDDSSSSLSIRPTVKISVLKRMIENLMTHKYPSLHPPFVYLLDGFKMDSQGDVRSEGITVDSVITVICSKSYEERLGKKLHTNTFSTDDIIGELIQTGLSQGVAAAFKQLRDYEDHSCYASILNVMPSYFSIATFDRSLVIQQVVQLAVNVVDSVELKASQVARAIVSWIGSLTYGASSEEKLSTVSVLSSFLPIYADCKDVCAHILHILNSYAASRDRNCVKQLSALLETCDTCPVLMQLLELYVDQHTIILDILNILYFFVDHNVNWARIISIPSMLERLVTIASKTRVSVLLVPVLRLLSVMNKGGVIMEDFSRGTYLGPIVSKLGTKDTMMVMDSISFLQSLSYSKSVRFTLLLHNTIPLLVGVAQQFQSNVNIMMSTLSLISVYADSWGPCIYLCNSGLIEALNSLLFSPYLDSQVVNALFNLVRLLCSNSKYALQEVIRAGVISRMIEVKSNHSFELDISRSLCVVVCLALTCPLLYKLHTRQQMLEQIDICISIFHSFDFDILECQRTAMLFMEEKVPETMEYPSPLIPSIQFKKSSPSLSHHNSPQPNSPKLNQSHAMLYPKSMRSVSHMFQMDGTLKSSRSPISSFALSPIVASLLLQDSMANPAPTPSHRSTHSGTLPPVRNAVRSLPAMAFSSSTQSPTGTLTNPLSSGANANANANANGNDSGNGSSSGSNATASSTMLSSYSFAAGQASHASPTRSPNPRSPNPHLSATGSSNIIPRKKAPSPLRLEGSVLSPTEEEVLEADSDIMTYDDSDLFSFLLWKIWEDSSEEQCLLAISTLCMLCHPTCFHYLSQFVGFSYFPPILCLAMRRYPNNIAIHKQAVELLRLIATQTSTGCYLLMDGDAIEVLVSDIVHFTNEFDYLMSALGVVHSISSKAEARGRLKRAGIVQALQNLIHEATSSTMTDIVREKSTPSPTPSEPTNSDIRTQLLELAKLIMFNLGLDDAADVCDVESHLISLVLSTLGKADRNRKLEILDALTDLFTSDYYKIMECFIKQNGINITISVVASAVNNDSNTDKELVSRSMELLAGVSDNHSHVKRLDQPAVDLLCFNVLRLYKNAIACVRPTLYLLRNLCKLNSVSCRLASELSSFMQLLSSNMKSLAECESLLVIILSIIQPNKNQCSSFIAHSGIDILLSVVQQYRSKNHILFIAVSILCAIAIHKLGERELIKIRAVDLSIRIAVEANNVNDLTLTKRALFALTKLVQFSNELALEFVRPQGFVRMASLLDESDCDIGVLCECVNVVHAVCGVGNCPRELVSSGMIRKLVRICILYTKEDSMIVKNACYIFCCVSSHPNLGVEALLSSQVISYLFDCLLIWNDDLSVVNAVIDTLILLCRSPDACLVVARKKNVAQLNELLDRSDVKDSSPLPNIWPVVEPAKPSTAFTFPTQPSPGRNGPVVTAVESNPVMDAPSKQPPLQSLVTKIESLIQCSKNSKSSLNCTVSMRSSDSEIFMGNAGTVVSIPGSTTGVLPFKFSMFSPLTAEMNKLIVFDRYSASELAKCLSEILKMAKSKTTAWELKQFGAQDTLITILKDTKQPAKVLSLCLSVLTMMNHHDLLTDDDDPATNVFHSLLSYPQFARSGECVSNLLRYLSSVLTHKSILPYVVSSSLIHDLVNTCSVLLSSHSLKTSMVNQDMEPPNDHSDNSSDRTSHASIDHSDDIEDESDQSSSLLPLLLDLLYDVSRKDGLPTDIKLLPLVRQSLMFFMDYSTSLLKLDVISRSLFNRSIVCVDTIGKEALLAEQELRILTPVAPRDPVGSSFSGANVNGVVGMERSEESMGNSFSDSNEMDSSFFIPISCSLIPAVISDIQLQCETPDGFCSACEKAKILACVDEYRKEFLENGGMEALLRGLVHVSDSNAALAYTSTVLSLVSDSESPMNSLILTPSVLLSVLPLISTHRQDISLIEQALTIVQLGLDNLQDVSVLVSYEFVPKYLEATRHAKLNPNCCSVLIYTLSVLLDTDLFSTVYIDPVCELLFDTIYQGCQFETVVHATKELFRRHSHHPLVLSRFNDLAPGTFISALSASINNGRQVVHAISLLCDYVDSEETAQLVVDNGLLDLIGTFLRNSSLVEYLKYIFVVLAHLCRFRYSCEQFIGNKDLNELVRNIAQQIVTDDQELRIAVDKVNSSIASGFVEPLATQVRIIHSMNTDFGPPPTRPPPSIVGTVSGEYVSTAVTV